MSKQSTLRVRNERDRQQARVWLDRMPLGWSLVFKPPTRTNPQNAQLWAILDDLSSQVVWHGQKLPSEEWKDICTAALKRQRVLPGIDGGFVVLGARTSEMSIEEMSDLIELARAFGTEQGVKWGDDMKGKTWKEPDPRPHTAGKGAGEDGAAGNASPAQRGAP